MKESPSHTEKEQRNDPEPNRLSVDPEDTPETENADRNDLDFVVTETEPNETELVGGYGPSGRSRDDLGIESNADLLEQEVVKDPQALELDLSDEADEFIEDAGPMPQPLNNDVAPFNDDSVIEPLEDQLTPPTSPDSIEKLSDDRIRELSEKMRGSEDPPAYLTEEEKASLLNNLSSVGGSAAPKKEEQAKGFDNSPIIPPKKAAAAAKREEQSPTKPQTAQSVHPMQQFAETPEKPKSAGRVRGVAFYYRNYIQIAGDQELHAKDEININGHDYLLRKKNLSNKLILSIIIPVAALVVFIIGAWLSSDANRGEGKIVGVVLDDYAQPYISGATVRFPDLGESYQTDGQGFFQTDGLPSGTQKIEYIVAGTLVGSEYATVASGEITTLTILPNEIEADEPPVEISQTSAPATPAKPAKKTSTPAVDKSTKKRVDNSKKKSNAPRFAKLTLSANVEGAKLQLDKWIAGAGNLTYKKVNPGKRRYTVSKEGYHTATGTINLRAGQSRTLEVSLEPIEVAQVPDPHPEVAYYNAALASMESQAYQSAIANLDEAIRLSPAYAKAYTERARAYQGLLDSRLAYADFTKAGYLLKEQGHFNDAVTAFNSAIALDDKSVDAYLGRGDIYLARGEEIAAIADYDMAVRIDKRTLRAYMGLGKARYNQGYHKKAIKRFKDARSLAPENPQVHRHLMLAYQAKGDKKQVRKSYEKYLQYASDTDARQLQADPQFAKVMSIVSE